ncbi:GNAT family N-acetyltransferase [Streptomyces sp. NPDC003077]|uniref:GNAT family N-acetyltransferase n=1 Tax=Streptomyces sp. NPDC003077 TaxID=3154443 RepID=UPI0033B269FE
MTTTLRPAGPEERRADGGRTRTYEVCVNSRPVGRVELRTEPRRGPATGLIADLRIDERERRRGRGTVAALAAEEVLRGWGCREIELPVPAGAEVALRLAAALGYTERSRRMRKPLTEVPALPEGSEDRPLTEAEYPAWLAASRATYVETRTAHGMPRAAAEEAADRSLGELLPDGLATPGLYLRVLVHDGTDVGYIWVTERELGRPGGYVYDVEVAPEHRGRGHGRTLLLIAERGCLAVGQRELGLNVYADNTAARSLYESLGYGTSEYTFWKPLL